LIGIHFRSGDFNPVTAKYKVQHFETDTFVAFQAKVGLIDVASVEDALRHLLPPNPPDIPPVADSNAASDDGGTSYPASQSEPPPDPVHQTETTSTTEDPSSGDGEPGKTETVAASELGPASAAALQVGAPSMEIAEDPDSALDSFYIDTTGESQQPTGTSFSAE